jgi:uncharacterized membrane protein YraQ (UPF0718 family)
MTKEQEREMLRTLTIIKWFVGITLGLLIGLWVSMASGCHESHHSQTVPVTRQGIQKQIKSGQRLALTHGWYVMVKRSTQNE